MKKIILILISYLALSSCTKEQLNEVPLIATELSTTIVTSRSIVLSGNIYNTGRDSVYLSGVVYSTNPNPTLADNKIINKTGSVNFISTIKGLIPENTYYTRAFATHKHGTHYSKQLTIKTSTFDFNWVSESGIPILSKTSEYIILIPDIQYYTAVPANHKYLQKIIDWIIEFDKSGFNVKTVLQVGDVTDLNTHFEWTTAQNLFSKLDKTIDYILCTGNHDYGDGGTTNSRETKFSQYFNYSNSSTFIASMDRNQFENAYFGINIHNQPLLLFSLEFGPRDKVLAWADSISKKNPEKLNILMTHAFLAGQGLRYDYNKFKYTQVATPKYYANHFPLFGKEKINDGEEIWQKLIFTNSNFKFVFCGHNLQPDNDWRLITSNKEKSNVFQMVYNKQDFPFGGEGWIKIIEFSKNRIASFKSYSTLLNIWDESSFQNEFNY
jgi:hypothetical protein